MIPRSVDIKIIFLVAGETLPEVSLIDSVSCPSWDPGSLSSGAGVISYIHEKIITAGKPRMTRATRSRNIHSGIRSAGIINWAACKKTYAVARYMVALLKTLRFFKSSTILLKFGNYNTLHFRTGIIYKYPPKRMLDYLYYKRRWRDGYWGYNMIFSSKCSLRQS